jgi:flagellar protein FlaG
MLIQNTSSAAQAPGFTGNGGPVAVAAPVTQPAPQPIQAPQPAVKAAPQQPTAAQLKSAVDNINRAMKQNNSNVEFSIDKNTKQPVIKVVESDTGQVIQQFPSAQVLAISQMIGDEQQHGILIKQDA